MILRKIAKINVKYLTKFLKKFMMKRIDVIIVTLQDESQVFPKFSPEVLKVGGEVVLFEFWVNWELLDEYHFSIG